MNDKSMKAPVISESRKQELLLFQKNNNLSFNNIELLNTAFTHSSYANEVKGKKVVDNERLEFLGDSILSIAVSEWLYENLPGTEGDCTRIRSYVVSEEALSKIANQLDIADYLIMGKGEELTGGRHKKAILADCMEAIFASVFLDAGFEKAKDFILGLTIPVIQDVFQNKYKKDYKTMLQEYVQKNFKKVPVYSLVSATGPDHDQMFYYNVTVQNKTYGPAGGHNKKDAEQNVAHLAWKELGFEDN